MILIDIDMPECCDKCSFLDDEGDYPYCRINGGSVGYTFNIRKYRMTSCPLREFNKNGRIVRPKSLGFDTRPKSLIGKKRK